MVFAALASVSGNAIKFGTSGGCEAIINLAKTHSRIASICEKACKVIHCLAQYENNSAWMGASGGCDVVGLLFISTVAMSVSAFMLAWRLATWLAIMKEIALV